MKKRSVLWTVGLLVVLAVVAVLIPASPIYIMKLLGRDKIHDGQPLSHWINQMASPDPDARDKAVKTLGSLGKDGGDVVPTLAKLMLEDPDRSVRIDASFALSRMAPASSAALAELTRALNDEEPKIRMNATLTLGLLGTDARPAVPSLIKALGEARNNTNCDTYHMTIQELAAISLGPTSAGTSEAVPALTEVLVKAYLLGNAHPLVGIAPALSDTLRRSNRYEMREGVARSLGAIGPPASPAVPLLKTLLSEDNFQLRRSVEEALVSIEGKTQK